MTHKAEVQKVKLLKITRQQHKEQLTKYKKKGQQEANENGHCRRRQNKQSTLLVRPDLMKGPGKVLPGREICGAEERGQFSGGDRVGSATEKWPM